MKDFQYKNIPSDTVFSIKAKTGRIRLRMQRISEREIETERDLLMIEKLMQETKNTHSRDNENAFPEMI